MLIFELKMIRNVPVQNVLLVVWKEKLNLQLFPLQFTAVNLSPLFSGLLRKRKAHGISLWTVVRQGAGHNTCPPDCLPQGLPMLQIRIVC